MHFFDIKQLLDDIKCVVLSCINAMYNVRKTFYLFIRIFFIKIIAGNKIIIKHFRIIR